VETFSFVIKAIQAYAGTDTEKLLRMIAAEMGHDLSRKMATSELGELLAEVGRLMDGLRLGEMAVTNPEPLEIRFHGCLGCDQIPGPGQEIYCPFRESLLKTVIDDKLAVDSSVKFLGSEGSEWGTKDCTFRIDLGGLQGTK